MSLAIEALEVRLGGRVAVAGASLDIPRGTLAAVVGPNGAGKTSLLRALVGLVPSRGRMRLEGADLRDLPNGERARRLAYLPQGHEAHWPLLARDIVALGRLPHGSDDPSRLTDRDRESVGRAMALTDTLPFAERAVTALSGGERARVALARVLAVEAPVILADEPTAALDPRHQIDVLSVLREASRPDRIVLAVTHDLGLAARFADLVAVMDEGRIVACGPPAEALSPEVLARVFRIGAFRTEHAGQPVLVPWS